MLIVILGWFGALVILGGYALFSLGKLPNGPVYQLTNLVGALFIALNVGAHGAWPSVVVNGIWAVIAAVVLVRMVRERRAASRAAERVETVQHEVVAAVPAALVNSVPVITAALAVVALAAVQADQTVTKPAFADGATERV